MPRSMPNRRRAFVALLAATVSVPLLNACGFQLRGTGNTATLPFNSVFVRGSTALTNELRTYVSVGNTPMAASEKAAEAIIEVVSEARDKQVLSVNSQGRVREYTLISRAAFQVR